jgi:hypothetical protein
MTIIVVAVEIGLCSKTSAIFAQSGSVYIEEDRRLNAEVQSFLKVGRFSEAIPLAQRLLAMREKALGHDHPAVATSLNNLAGFAA